MKKWFDYTKADEDFVTFALVPEKRKAKIEQLEMHRKLYLGWGVFMGFFSLLPLLLYRSSGGLSGVWALIILLPILQFHRVDAQIKLLKTIDRMDSSEE